MTDADPVVQIERLAMWDNASDKLVQINHPNIPQMVGDRDFDGTPDEGFERMFGFMDVIEVHPPAAIFTPPTGLPASDRDMGNKIFHWMQLLNIGYRVPGVGNTDAHWNFHGSGWIRNYIKSPTDNPPEAQIMDLVHASEHGQIVMTNGPFLEVTATAGPNGQDKRVDVGGDIEQVLNQRCIIGAFPWKYEGLEACPCRIIAFFDCGAAEVEMLAGGD